MYTSDPSTVEWQQVASGPASVQHIAHDYEFPLLPILSADCKAPCAPTFAGRVITPSNPSSTAHYFNIMNLGIYSAPMLVNQEGSTSGTPPSENLGRSALLSRAFSVRPY